MNLQDLFDTASTKKFKAVGTETRNKMRDAKIGTTKSAESRAKNSVSHKGMKRSDETRANISAAATGKIVSEETREKRRKPIMTPAGIFKGLEEAAAGNNITKATLQSRMRSNQLHFADYYVIKDAK